MESSARALFASLLVAGSLLAQEPKRPEPPSYEGDPWARLERDDKLIDLQWRRDANGNLEWAIAGAKDAKWKPAFGDGIDGVLGPAGITGYVVPLLHNGDLLSLTDGESHLRRLQLATDTAALLAFARAPLGETPSRHDELDRLVAVDVLRSRSDDEAKRALAQLADDAAVPAAVRARAAAAAIVRERLGADELLLPEKPDLVVLVDHGRLVDAHPLLGLGRYTGLVSSAMFLSVLKMPRLDDAAIGQAESDSVLEVPFELVRRLGAMRLDQTCVCVTWTDAIGGDFTWTAAAAGSFEPARIAETLLASGFELLTTGVAGRRGVQWRDGSGEFSDRRVTAGTGAGAARAELASHVLREGAYSVRLHVPAGSKLLLLLGASGLPGATSLDFQVTLGDTIHVHERITTGSEEAAAKLAAALPRTLERLAEQNELASGLLDKVGAPKPTIDKNVVTTTREIRVADLPLPTMAAVRKWIVDRMRTR